MIKATTLYTREELLLELVEDYVCWSGGVGREWEGSALTDPTFLQELTVLAAYAPKTAIAAFVEKYKETE
jgi:hypothetical protein